LTLPKLGNQKP